MLSLTSCVWLRVLSAGPGNGWSSNKAPASCAFSMRVLFWWFNLHLVCGVPGYEKRLSLFWVMRAEVSNKHFWVQSVSSVIWVTRNCCSSASPEQIKFLHNPQQRDCRMKQDTKKTGLPNAIPDLCLYIPGKIEAPFPTPSVGWSALVDKSMSSVCHKPRKGKSQSGQFFFCFIVLC